MSQMKMDLPPSPSLSTLQRFLFLGLSWLFVAFGQPASAEWMGLIAAVCGYALCWRVLLDFLSPKRRMVVAALWFAAVQLVQLSWLISHPYSYIYAVYIAFALMWGVQYGILALFITPQNVRHLLAICGLAAAWTLAEWSRLFFLSGYSWNPAGLALTGSIFPMQVAAIGGVFALTFWVMLVNGVLLWAWQRPFRISAWGLVILLALLPYGYGTWQVDRHGKAMDREIAQGHLPFRALLVQTAFPTEEILPFQDQRSFVDFVFGEWREILALLSPHLERSFDLIALPEYVVPFNTYAAIYPYEAVKSAFVQQFGMGCVPLLPQPTGHLGRPIVSLLGEIPYVTNGFWMQAIANIFKSGVIAGLEDADYHPDGSPIHYSAAIFFQPELDGVAPTPVRYAKRVLLPFAEYIPSTWCRQLAAAYGIEGSFTCGSEATLFSGLKVPFGASICYEETFGHLMRESRQQGAQLLVNLSSDVWYPYSRLPQQHRDHARLRSVENGFPLLRACNTGVTCGYDSIGREVALLGKGDASSEWLAAALPVSISTYHYETPYTRWGDNFIVAISAFCLLLCCLKFYFKGTS
jgi:apolipoprotein N-acyltransferase